MAWFGETFGDGLSSLKGQITKITKDVLSDDPLASTSFEGRIKELEELCEAKSTEIGRLQGENERLRQSKGFELTEDQIQNLCLLENQLHAVTSEKDALNKSLDELDLEHQREIEVIIKDRNALRNELDKLRQSKVNGNDKEELQVAFSQLELQNNILIEESKLAQSDVIELTESNKARSRECEALSEENCRLKSQLENARKKHESLMSDLEKANSNSASKDSEIKKLSSTLNKEENHSRESEAIIEENALLKSHLEDARKMHESLSSELETANSFIAAKESEIEVLRSALNEKENALHSIQLSSHDLSDNNSSLQAKINSLEHNYHELESKYTSDTNELKNKILELESESETIKKVMTENEILKTDISRLESELQSEKESNKSKISEFEMVMANKNSEIEEICSKLSCAEEKIESLMSLSDSNQSKSSEQQLFEEQNTQLRKQLEETQSLLSSSEKTSAERLQSIELLRSENAKLSETLQAAETESEQQLLEEQNTQLQKQLEEIQSLLSSCEKTSAERLQSIELLRNENAKLSETIQATATESTDKTNRYIFVSELNEKLKAEICNLKGEIKKLQENITGSQSVHSDWLESLETQMRILHAKLGTSVAGAGDAVFSLQKANERLTELMAEQQERAFLVSDAVNHSMEQLKSVLGRMRREFSGSESNEQFGEPSQRHEQINGDNLLSLSQTDDFKRLKQDMAQMTEIVNQIDQNLNSIQQSNHQTQQETAVLRSMYNKTEKELALTRTERDELLSKQETNVALLEAAENELKKVTNLKSNLEEEKIGLNSEKNDFMLRVVSLQEEKNNMEMDLKIFQERVKELEEKIDSQAATEIDNLETATSQQLEMLNASISGKEDENRLFREGARDSSIDSEKIKELQQEIDQWKKSSSESEAEFNVLKLRCGELEERESRNFDIQSRLESDLANERKNLSETRDSVNRLQEENSDLKSLIQQLRESICAMNESKAVGSQESATPNLELLKAELLQEQAKYRQLIAQHETLAEKESGLQRELQRLREHLVEVEEHYTAEAVETERAVGEYRSKLANAEEQLRASSTVYKSANVRSTQHVESLQSQIRLITVQRDDLQEKLSAAEDQVQKHSAAQASLQMVLEQFQLDKEREIQANANKHDYLLHLARKRSEELEFEISALNDQLVEAKNGLKAASRLGEQLDKKTQKINQLEEQLQKTHNDISELKQKLSAVNQSASAKIDKFLVKNLVVGYLSTSQGDRKTQALKILASVLDLDNDEKSRIGLDGQGGWFSGLLSPRGEPTGESLSQAFVRFLESESRPQPQLRLLADAGADNTRRPPSVLTDLVLPSVTQTQVTESSESVLKGVLRDS